MFGKQDPITLYQLSSWLNHFVFRGKNPKTKMKRLGWKPIAV